MAEYGGCGLDVDLASEVPQLLFPKSSPVRSWCCIGVKNRMAQENLFQALKDFGASGPPEDDCTANVIDLHGPFTAGP